MKNDNGFLRFEDGIETVELWLIDFKINRENDPEKKKFPHLMFTFAESSMSDNPEAPCFYPKLNFPTEKDSIKARINKNKNFKKVLYPLLSLEEDAKINSREIEANLKSLLRDGGTDDEGNVFKPMDILCKVKLETTSVQSETSIDREGNPIVFSNSYIQELEVIKTEDKPECSDDIML